MAALIASNKLRQQPQGPVQIAAPGVVVCYLPTAGVDLVTNGVVRNAAGSTALTTLTRVVSEQGLGYKSTGAGGSELQLVKPYTFTAGTDWTILAAFARFEPPGGGQQGGVWRSGATATGNSYCCFNATNYPRVQINGTSLINPGSGEAPTTGAPLVCAFRFKNAASIDAWWAGRQRHTASHSTAMIAADITVLAKNFNSVETAGALTLFAVFNRALSDSELAEYTLNPWAIFRPSPARIWVPTAAASTTVAPGAGTLTLAGLAPTAQQALQVSPGAGALALAGLAPSLQLALQVSPGAGALALVGLAPSLQQALQVTPLAGALALAGLAPSLTTDAIAQPGLGALALTGLAPTAQQAITVAPSAGALTLAGLTPLATVDTSGVVRPADGALALEGLAPVLQLGITVAPAAGTLALAGLAPAITSDVLVHPAAGALALAGLAPALQTSTLISVPAGQLTFAGEVPSLIGPADIPVPAGDLVLAGLAPSVVATGQEEGVLDPKYLDNRNVRFKPLKKDAPPATPPPAEITNVPHMVEPARGALAAAIAAVKPQARGLDLAPSSPKPSSTTVPAPSSSSSPAPSSTSSPAPKPATLTLQPPAPKPVPATEDQLAKAVLSLTEQLTAALKQSVANSTRLEIELSKANAQLAEMVTKLGEIHEQQAADSAKSDARHKKFLAAENARRAAEIASRLMNGN